MTATATAPMGARQINQNLYVGQSDLSTIQKAITFAAGAGGGFAVIIPAGYAGSDPIAAVAGGSATTYISDQRGTSAQSYFWNGGQYVPADLVQLGVISAPSAEFDAITATTATITTLNIEDITAATAEFTESITAPLADFTDLTTETLTATTATIPTFAGDVNFEGNIAAQKKIRAYGFSPIDLAASHVTLGVSNTGGYPLLTLVQSSQPVDQKQWTMAAVDDQLWFSADSDGGENFPWMVAERTGTDVTLVTITPPLTLDGVLTLAGDPTQPLQAATKGYVDEAITESGNFVYPGAGVTVSTGSAWATPINPAALAYINAANAFTGNQAIDGNLTISGQINPSGGPMYLNWAGGQPFHIGNGAAFPVIDVNPDTSVGIHGAVTIFSTAVTTSWLAGFPDATAQGGVGVLYTGYQLNWNLDGLGEFDFINSTGGNGGAGGFAWFNAAANSHLGPGTAPLMKLTSAGDLMPTGRVIALSSVSAEGSNPIAAGTTIDYSPTGDGVAYGRMLAVSAAASAIAPDMVFICLSGDGSDYREFLRYHVATSALNVTGNLNLSGAISTGVDGITILNDFHIWNDGGSSYIDGGENGRILINQNRSSGVVEVTGAFTVNGTKNFVIPHPLDANKKLTHSCIEGPEVAVFYRGEVNVSEGKAEVELPDYFEALTEPDGRTVLLTQIFDDDDQPLALLAASQVRAGKFRIRTNLVSVRVAWEVKAIRAGASIEVVSAREEAA